MLFFSDLVKKFLEWKGWELVCNFKSKSIIKYYILKSFESLRFCACVIIFSLTDFNVICPWEAYSHLELHELAQYGII